MAVLLLVAVMGFTLKLVTWVGGERRGGERRLLAVEWVSNVLERATAEPFDSVVEARVRELARGADPSGVLPGAEWTVEVADRPAPGGVRGKLVRIALRWRSRVGEWDAPVRVSAWVYERGARS
ncbi:MAG: hypothetical protein U0835_18905 [Isosphaeraceae bacterium]